MTFHLIRPEHQSLVVKEQFESPSSWRSCLPHATEVQVSGGRGLAVETCGSVQGVVELIGELVVFPPVGFAQHLSHSAHGAPAERSRSSSGDLSPAPLLTGHACCPHVLVEDFPLQSGPGRVAALLQVAQVGVLLLLLLPFLLFPAQAIGAQVLPRRCLDVAHQLRISPVCDTEIR